MFTIMGHNTQAVPHEAMLRAGETWYYIKMPPLQNSYIETIELSFLDYKTKHSLSENS